MKGIKIDAAIWIGAALGIGMLVAGAESGTNFLSGAAVAVAGAATIAKLLHSYLSSEDRQTKKESKGKIEHLAG